MVQTKIWDKSELAAAVKAIKRGALVAFPSETVYGLGADAFNDTAVSKVYAAKGRPSDNPLIVHVADIEQVGRVALVNTWAEKLMAAFWPGPLTMILPVKPDTVSATVTGGLDTVAVRMPDNDLTRELIRLTDTPLVGPSANTSGKPSPTTAQHVFHDLHGKIAGVLDDGATKIGVESTVIDLSTEQPAVLRPGKITPAQLEAVLGVTIDSELKHVSADEAPKAPGMKYRHYAPDKAVYMVADDDWTAAIVWAQGRLEPVGLMLTNNQIAKHQLSGMDFVWSLGANEDTAAANLFAGLRRFDDWAEVTTILVTALPDIAQNAAYNNRLGKASGGHWVNELFD
ncbi:SUA5 family translation factor [Weissella oryzae SG25]|uniref:Threonylcarbamoyl-AMP synthase n=1 Tax=Weissella oryzae (strain DSM 25784 / JCM 18191 / LMG 30913 / SG25) TaxID=1329250 RepID=A0A069CY60_WEIOS|nr:L-threonylcarbamoyladenylate synthase [Weissella oryzae]GAK30036.1 SUA5 family translation factor [Weissella oryzae SG25]